MKKIISKYLQEVKSGKSKRAMSKWNGLVSEILGVDNLRIFYETGVNKGNLK